jgi:hypothetical protein
MQLITWQFCLSRMRPDGGMRYVRISEVFADNKISVI